jgi:hypothetical protein
MRARFAWLFVIARNSAFAYKGRAADVKQVGRELGVRYVLEGSVRRAGDRVRVSAQLVDAVADGCVWAEQFDRRMLDVFDLQDDIVASIAATVAPEITAAEIGRARSKRPNTLTAWDRTGVGPFLHNDARDRPPEISNGTVTLHTGGARDAWVMLPVISQ